MGNRALWHGQQGGHGGFNCPLGRQHQQERRACALLIGERVCAQLRQYMADQLDSQ